VKQSKRRNGKQITLNSNKIMKTMIKVLVGAAMIGAASMSANAGVRIGLSFGIPLPVPVVAPAPVYVAPTPVVVAAPACPPPAYTTAYVVQPACPGPQYAWIGGYWSVNTYGRFWVPGAWHYQGHPVVAAHFGGGYGYGHGGYHR
jgi:hypothetical protein